MSWLNSLFGNKKNDQKTILAKENIEEESDNIEDKDEEDSKGIEISGLIELLQHGDDKQREKVIIDLWNTRDPRAVPPIILALQDPSEKVKARAIKAFHYLRDDRGILPLIQVLKTEKSIDLKAAAADSLAGLGAKVAIDPIRELLLDKDNADTLTYNGPKYHVALKDALKRLGGMPTVQNPSDLQGKSREIALSLKLWYRDNAITWWKSNKGMPSKVCDDGNEIIKAGEGFLRPGNYLCCENHVDFLLCNADWEQAVKNLDGYFGPGLPDRIKSLAR